MPLNPLVDSRDVRFVLFEMLHAETLNRYDLYADFDREIFESTLGLAEQISVNRIHPANIAGDREKARFNPETGDVTAPAQYREAMKIFREAGFPGMIFEQELGGMGLPILISRAAFEYFFAGSIAFMTYMTLGMGAANLVKKFMPDSLKKIYLEKMVSGKWGGTMCLTEADAGSDVGALKTRAVKQPDGTYLITGQKIFITAGDNDLYENIIHPVLARIEGDPAGTRGISIFLVPKFIPESDGSIGERNDMVCSGIEHKMGLNGSATCTLNFGDNGRCVGYLMGEERQGMKIMFNMMNEARIDVALQGQAVSSAAYMHAVKYARGRIQGNDMLQKQGPSSKPVTIITHPDVRRMLLWMKTHVEAMRMLMSFTCLQMDLAHVEKGDAAAEAVALLDFLIPILKAGSTDNAWLITSEAIQIHGGYGYCSDYPVEQYARDSKILSIFEGTNGIQAMDLTMRKLLMNPDMYNYMVYKKRILETVAMAEGIADKKYIKAVSDGLGKIDVAVNFLNRKKGEGNFNHILSTAKPLLNAFTMLSYAWMHLWTLSIALPAMKKISGGKVGRDLEDLIKNDSEAAYYHGKILSSRFYLGSEFMKFFSIVDIITSEETALLESESIIFTGAPDE